MVGLVCNECAQPSRALITFSDESGKRRIVIKGPASTADSRPTDHRHYHFTKLVTLNDTAEAIRKYNWSSL